MWLALIMGSILAYVVFRFYNKKAKEQELKEKYKQYRDAFIGNAEKIKVDLTRCKIKRYDYVEERAHTYREYQLNKYGLTKNYDSANQWSGDMMREESLRAVVIFETIIDGKKWEFKSPIIQKDKMTLRFLLGRQQDTYLYIDKTNPEKYFFDFDFITDECE